MKKAIGSLFMLFGILAALLIGGASAQATVPTSNCVNGQHGLVNAVICEIDVDDNDTLNNLDIKVIALNEVLNDTKLNLLAVELDDLVDIGDISVEDVVVINDVVDIVVGHPVIIIVLPCGC